MRQSKPVLPIPEGCQTCGQALTETLASNSKTSGLESSLVARFRPIAQLAGGSIFGHLASVHGSAEKSLFPPSRLAGVAWRLGRAADLYRRYFEVAADRFVAYQGQGYLLLPLADAASELGEGCTAMLVDALAKAGLSCDQVIVVHAGVGGLDGAALERALATTHGLRRSGFKLAAVSLTCPRSEKLLWSVFHPEFAMIEEGALEGVDSKLLGNSHYAGLIASAAARNRRVIALGIDSLGLLKSLRESKVAYVAGDFIGRPVAAPTRTLSAAAHKAISDAAVGRASQRQEGLHVLDKMLHLSLIHIFRRRRKLPAYRVTDTPCAASSRLPTNR